MTRTDLARAICCPSGTCCSPDACYAEDRSRSQLVDIHSAVEAIEAWHNREVAAACEATRQAIRDAWRATRGPMSRTTHLPDDDERRRMREAMEVWR